MEEEKTSTETSQAAMPAVKAPKDGALKKLFSAPRAFVAEYFVLLLVTLGLLSIVNALFSGIVDHIGSNKPVSRFGGNFSYTGSLVMLATVAVLVPVLIMFTRRHAAAEDAGQTKQSAWARAFLSIFLVAVTLYSVGYAIAFVYNIFSILASQGLQATEWSNVWKSLSKQAFGVVLFSVTALLYVKDYRGGIKSELLKKSRRMHRYALVSTAIVLAAVYAFVVLSYQRGTFIDSVIVNDLRSIRTEVSKYERQKRQLPKDLGQVSLKDEVKKRAQKYNYEYTTSKSGYELCATFKTDASKPNEITPVLDQLSSGSSSSISQPPINDPSSHGKGRQCFDYSAVYSKPTPRNPIDSSLDSLYE